MTAPQRPATALAPLNCAPRPVPAFTPACTVPRRRQGQSLSVTEAATAGWCCAATPGASSRRRRHHWPAAGRPGTGPRRRVDAVRRTGGHLPLRRPARQAAVRASAGSTAPDVRQWRPDGPSAAAGRGPCAASPWFPTGCPSCWPPSPTAAPSSSSRAEKTLAAMSPGRRARPPPSPWAPGSWRPSYTEWFEGADVTIVADDDEPGRRHARLRRQGPGRRRRRRVVIVGPPPTARRRRRPPGRRLRDSTSSRPFEPRRGHDSSRAPPSATGSSRAGYHRGGPGSRRRPAGRRRGLPAPLCRLRKRPPSRRRRPVRRPYPCLRGRRDDPVPARHSRREAIRQDPAAETLATCWPRGRCRPPT